MKAVEATKALCLETIDRPRDVDQILAENLGRETIDGLTDECIDNVIEPLSNIGDHERFHVHIVPNICSSLYGSSTDNVCPDQVTDISGKNIREARRIVHPCTPPTHATGRGAALAASLA
jgi:hypothetical protein